MHLRPRMTRALALAALAVTAPLAVGAGGALPAAAQSAPFTQSTRAAAAPEIPDSPAGKQLRWFLDATGRAPLDASEIEQHVSAEFLKHISVDGFNGFLKQAAGLRLDTLTEVSPTSLAGTATLAGQKFDLQLAVDADGKIDGVGVAPSIPSAPTSWSKLDARLGKVARTTGFLAAEIDGPGRCETVHAVKADTPRPLGSIFKLYVLGAVAEQIRAGKLSWDTKLTLTPEVKLPAEDGLGTRPDNSTVTVHEAAKLMISISDNTATDLLIHTVGRKAVEKKVRQWSDHAKLNMPFLTVREWFLLKSVDYPRHARAYLARDTADRRTYLKDVVAGLPVAADGYWAGQRPRKINSIEWFGSPRDICRAYAGLLKLDSDRLNDVMSANDAGLRLDPGAWPTVWYKGGSEVGVLTMAFLGRTAKGRTYVVTTLASDSRAPINESAAAPEMISLSRGGFGLVR
ncbi:serine hydrolase [Planomonospora sp. ID67723]|uniref:serine hydrolase n=1 Tax=Planomonospora sp. ID67723 TaxID=2738134 RepID=UPI0018C411DB|nr:serine hydrolase [Planomonospora sp. ID67723]MBG0826434.1 serine hydrolase [Planomonospora sp. ID67723]